MNTQRIDFCTHCRKETEYYLSKKDIKKIIKDKEYNFKITIAVCKECGKEISIPSLIDLNIKEIDQQYRDDEDIISIEDIKKLMSLYHIGKAPLSLALGFGEITIKRYIAGQVPSKEYSDIMKTALSSPGYMKQKLEENKDKLALTAYSKALDKTFELENLFSFSDRLKEVINYLFGQLEEISPSSLHSLLYFSQGISYALNGKPMFEEECMLSSNGLVYKDVYNLFKDFPYDPREYERFVLLENTKHILNKEDYHILDLVIHTFGLYSYKALKKIIIEELNDDLILVNQIVHNTYIESYFKTKDSEYNFSNVEGIMNYIDSIL